MSGSMYPPIIFIEGRAYHRNPAVDRYQVPYTELGALTIGEVPRQSHLEVVDFPIPPGIETEFYAVNASSDVELSLSIYGGPSIQCNDSERTRRIAAKMMRVFAEYLNEEGKYSYSPLTVENNRVYLHIGLNFSDAPNTKIHEAFVPIVRLMNRLVDPTHKLFICHASEDKPKARSIARSLRSLGSDVWLDEWEIRVGDSIVQKINEALGSVTHLVVLLSENSTKKPWVSREWSAALMKQLSDQSISVLPARLDDSAVPPILADLRYADCRRRLRDGVREIEQTLYPTRR